MEYEIGDLLPLEHPYLQDSRFLLVWDNTCELLHLLESIGCTEYASGALVDVGEGDYTEVWITGYRRPFALSSIYERVATE